MATAVTLKKPDGTEIYPVTDISLVNDGIHAVDIEATSSVPPISNDMIDWSTIDYTTEQPIGQWFNGKTLYRKGYDIGYLTSSDVSKPLGITGLTQIISIRGALKQSNGTTVDIPNVSSTSENIVGVYTDSTNIHVLSYKTRTGDYASLVLEYIK